MSSGGARRWRRAARRPVGGGRHQHDPAVVDARVPLGQAGLQQALHGAGGGRRVDAQPVGQLAHAPGRLAHQQVERVPLARLESVSWPSPNMWSRSAPMAAPRRSSFHDQPMRTSELVLLVDRISPGGGDRRDGRGVGGHLCRVQAVDTPGGDDAGNRPQTPLRRWACWPRRRWRSPTGLRHLELYTMRGLLTVLWHGTGDEDARGGGHGRRHGRPARPGRGPLPPAGRRCWRATTASPRCASATASPNDLDACVLDAAAAVQLAVGNGAERVVTLGPLVRRRGGRPHRRAAGRDGGGRVHVRHPVGRLRDRRRPVGPPVPAVPRRPRRDPARRRQLHRARDRRAGARWWCSRATATCWRSRARRWASG